MFLFSADSVRQVTQVKLRLTDLYSALFYVSHILSDSKNNASCRKSSKHILEETDRLNENARYEFTTNYNRNIYSRWIREAVKIRQESQGVMNRDEGAYQLS